MSLSSLEYMRKRSKEPLTEKEQELVEIIIPVLKDAGLTYEEAYDVLYKTALALAYRARFIHLE